MATAHATQVMKLNDDGGSNSRYTNSATVMATTNWLALKATLYQAQRRYACPARLPRSTLSVRTLGDTRMSAGTHTASVTEKFSTSVRCLTATVNCSLSAAASASPAVAATSSQDQVRISGTRRRTPNAPSAT